MLPTYLPLCYLSTNNMLPIYQQYATYLPLSYLPTNFYALYLFALLFYFGSTNISKQNWIWQRIAFIGPVDMPSSAPAELPSSVTAECNSESTVINVLPDPAFAALRPSWYRGPKRYIDKLQQVFNTTAPTRFIEIFSGQCGLSKALQSHGHIVHSYDKHNDPSQDILDTSCVHKITEIIKKITCIGMVWHATRHLYICTTLWWKRI